MNEIIESVESVAEQATEQAASAAIETVAEQATKRSLSKGAKAGIAGGIAVALTGGVILVNKLDQKKEKPLLPWNKRKKEIEALRASNAALEEQLNAALKNTEPAPAPAPAEAPKA